MDDRLASDIDAARNNRRIRNGETSSDSISRGGSDVSIRVAIKCPTV